MYFDISIKIALIISVIALVSNAALCFIKSGYNISSQLKEITVQCRWIGLLYFAFAWFMSDAKTAYQQVAQYMLLISIGWIIVFVLSSVSKFWSSGDKLGKKVLGMGIMYFVLSYLLH